LWIIKPAAWRGNYIGLVGSVLIFGSIWLNPDKQTIPRDILIIGCLICILGLLNHIIFLFTKEAKENIWEKGGLLTLAMTPASWRGMRMGWLGLIISFLSVGLFWLGFKFAIMLFPVGWLIGIIGGYNHTKWMFKKNNQDS